MEQLVSFVVSATVLTIAQTSLFIMFSEFRWERKKSIAMIYFFVVLDLILYFACAVKDNYQSLTEKKMLLCTIPIMAVFFVFSKHRKLKFFTTYCVTNMTITLADFWAYLLALLVVDDNWLISCALRIIFIIGWTLVLCRWVKNRWRQALNWLQNGWGIMFFTLVVMYLLLCILSAYPTEIAKRIEDVPAGLLMVIVMEFAIALGICMIFYMIDLREQEVRSHIFQNQLAIAEQQFHFLTKKDEEIRRFRHDTKYHLGVLYGYLGGKEYEKAQEYLAAYQQELSSFDTAFPAFTENQGINILIGYYVQQAREQGIRMDADIRVPEAISIEQTHLTVLLGNLWRNALEACKAIPEDKERFIETMLCVDGDKLIVKCKNSSPGIKKNKQGQLLSTKGKGHGRGLISMGEVVNHYKGFYTVSETDGVFCYTAALYKEET